MCAYICRVGFNFESAATPVVYEPHRTGRIAALLEKDEATHLEFICLPAHLSGQAFVHCDARGDFSNIVTSHPHHPEAKMTVYRAYIVGLHDRSIGVVQLDCINDESAIKSAGRLVDGHDVELWQMDRPVARFDAQSKQICRK
jgi:hypothetical protein